MDLVMRFIVKLIILTRSFPKSKKHPKSHRDSKSAENIFEGCTNLIEVHSSVAVLKNIPKIIHHLHRPLPELLPDPNPRTDLHPIPATKHVILIRIQQRRNRTLLQVPRNGVGQLLGVRRGFHCLSSTNQFCSSWV